MASVKKAPRYCYWRGDVLWARLKIAGREHRETLRTGDPREAARRVKTLRVRLQREAVAGPSPQEGGHSWQEAVDKWTAEVLPGSVKPAVALRYAVSLRQLEPVFGGVLVEAITVRHVADYVSGRVAKASNATVRRDLTALSRLLAACCAWGWRQDNPARAYDRRMIRERREPIRPPSLEEIAVFVAAAPVGVAAVLRLSRWPTVSGPRSRAGRRTSAGPGRPPWMTRGTDASRWPVACTWLPGLP